MRPDLEAAIEYLPGLASLALWCRFADTDDPEAIAYTDGSTIYAGAEYEKREPRTRRFICLHEILHIALCHPQRFAELEKRDPAGFDQKLLNIAADAVINTSLENLTGLETPQDAWTLSRILAVSRKERRCQQSKSGNLQKLVVLFFTRRRATGEKNSEFNQSGILPRRSLVVRGSLLFSEKPMPETKQFFTFC